eukprot:6473684-Amphidinium_carterae.4
MLNGKYKEKGSWTRPDTAAAAQSDAIQRQWKILMPETWRMGHLRYCMHPSRNIAQPDVAITVEEIEAALKCSPPTRAPGLGGWVVTTWNFLPTMFVEGLRILLNRWMQEQSVTPLAHLLCTLAEDDDDVKTMHDLDTGICGNIGTKNARFNINLSWGCAAEDLLAVLGGVAKTALHSTDHGVG